MATDTIIMVVLICVGCSLVLAGVGYAGYQGWRLVTASREIKGLSKNRVQQIAGRVQRLAPRLRDLETKQKTVAESIERLSTTADRSKQPPRQQQTQRRSRTRAGQQYRPDARSEQANS